MSENWVIGFSKRLPWHLPEDLRHFRKVTIDHTIIMGRKTFESIGRPLPRRRNIVISASKMAAPKGIELVGSFAEALDNCRKERRVYVIGGGQIFIEALPLADRIHLTLVYLEDRQISLFQQAIPGDVYFPYIDPREWRIRKLGQRRPARTAKSSKKRGVYYRFIELERSAPPASKQRVTADDRFHWSLFPLAPRSTRKLESNSTLLSHFKAAIG
jgi:dihydrofolate reductase